MALLHVDGFPVFGGRNENGLPAQKGRNLHTSTACATRAHCSASCTSEEHDFQAVADFGEYRQRRSNLMPRAALAEVRLALSNEVLKTSPMPFGRNLFERGGHFQRMRPAFQLAGTGDQRQRQGIAKADGADRDGGVGNKVAIQDGVLAGATMKRGKPPVNGTLRIPARRPWRPMDPPRPPAAQCSTSFCTATPSRPQTRRCQPRIPRVPGAGTPNRW